MLPLLEFHLKTMCPKTPIRCNSTYTKATRAEPRCCRAIVDRVREKTKLLTQELNFLEMQKRGDLLHVSRRLSTIGDQGIIERLFGVSEGYVAAFCLCPRHTRCATG